jgi:hypothetical protein
MKGPHKAVLPGMRGTIPLRTRAVNALKTTAILPGSTKAA